MVASETPIPAVYPQHAIGAQPAFEAEATEGGIIGTLDKEFVQQFSAEIIGSIPKEKVQCELRQAQHARIMQQMGSVTMEGLGQRVAKIDARLYFRMLQSFGHEENWLDDFLADNAYLCAPGYRPRQNSTRHGITYVGGQAVGAGPHSEKRG